KAQLDEKLQFKVIEFNKDAKRIIVSHSRVYEDETKPANAVAEKTEHKSAVKRGSRKNEISAVQNQVASTTLGDIDALAELKEKMEGDKK
ncbi:MAG: 30S ribosomal protein S1, partial [Bacteroidaceae bacterium]|nr:30S ribosomal protein S1 [Bacteroidaceae bacterium]